MRDNLTLWTSDLQDDGDDEDEDSRGDKGGDSRGDSRGEIEDEIKIENNENENKKIMEQVKVMEMIDVMKGEEIMEMVEVIEGKEEQKEEFERKSNIFARKKEKMKEEKWNLRGGDDIEYCNESNESDERDNNEERDYKERDYEERDDKEREYKERDNNKERDYKERDYEEREYKERDYEEREYKERDNNEERDYKEKDNKGRDFKGDFKGEYFEEKKTKSSKKLIPKSKKIKKSKNNSSPLFKQSPHLISNRLFSNLILDELDGCFDELGVDDKPNQINNQIIDEIDNLLGNITENAINDVDDFDNNDINNNNNNDVDDFDNNDINNDNNDVDDFDNNDINNNNNNDVDDFDNNDINNDNNDVVDDFDNNDINNNDNNDDDFDVNNDDNIDIISNISQYSFQKQESSYSPPSSPRSSLSLLKNKTNKYKKRYIQRETTGALTGKITGEFKITEKENKNLKINEKIYLNETPLINTLLLIPKQYSILEMSNNLLSHVGVTKLKCKQFLKSKFQNFYKDSNFTKILEKIFITVLLICWTQFNYDDYQWNLLNFYCSHMQEWFSFLDRFFIYLDQLKQSPSFSNLQFFFNVDDFWFPDCKNFLKFHCKNLPK